MYMMQTVEDFINCIEEQEVIITKGKFKNHIANFKNVLAFTGFGALCSVELDGRLYDFYEGTFTFVNENIQQLWENRPMAV